VILSLFLFVSIAIAGASALPPGSAAFAAGGPTGTAVWRSGSLTTPKSNQWDGSGFGTAGTTADVGAWRILVGAEAPSRGEMIVLGLDASGVIGGEMRSGSSWAALPFSPLATVSVPSLWGFAVAYEEQSGEAVVVWNNGTTGTEGLSYRVWDGTAWSSEATITTPLAGEPVQMRLAANPNSDEMVLAVSSEGGDYALVWDGSSWDGGCVLDDSGYGDDPTTIYVAYEQQSGRALVTYSKASTSIYYRIWTGSEWLDEASLAKPTDAEGDALWAVLAADPTGDAIALGVLTPKKDIWLSVWDGASWEAPTTATTSCTYATCPNVAVAFEGTSGGAVATYGEVAYIRCRTWSNGGGWSAEGNAGAVGTGVSTLTLDTAPRSDNIMLSVHDNLKDVNFVLWDGSAWGTPSEQETDTKETLLQPLVFVWNRLPPSPDLDITKHVDDPAPHAGDAIVYDVTVTNVGELPATGVSVFDALPGGLTYQNHTASRGDYDAASGEWTVGSLAAGAVADLAIEVGVNQGTQGWTITNVAAVADINENDPNPANDRDSVQVTVVDRPPVLELIGSKSVTEGQELQFTVSASDSDGATPWLLAVDLPDNATFADNGDGTGTFDFTPDYSQAGAYSVLFIASDGALADSERVAITVDPAPLAYIVVAPDSVVVSADSTATFKASGYDAGGNPYDPGTITWSLTVPVGTINRSKGVFTATTAGISRVVAVSSEGPVDTTSYLEVVPGRPASVDVVPAEAVAVEGSSYQFAANAYDADGNLVGDRTADAAWSTTDPSGSVTAGLYVAGHTLSPPDFVVKAALGTARDSSAVTVVAAGGLHHVRVELSNGTELEDTTLATDNDATKLYCRAYDGGGAPLGDVPATWSLISAEPVGSVVAGPAASTTLTLNRPGTGRVVAQYEAGVSDTTGVIAVVAGVPARIVIAPDTATVMAGNSLQFVTATLDADGNPSVPVAISSWGVVGGIGTISSGGLFAASTAGAGRIWCSAGALRDTTGTITVTAGPLARLEVAPDSVRTGVGGTVAFGATGFDAYGNAAGTGSLTWALIGAIGRISSAGVFTAEQPGTGRVAARSSLGGVADTNRAVVVLEEDLWWMAISPDTATVSISGAVTFTAHGFDDNFEPATPGELSWQVLGGIGAIDGAGVFTANARGKGFVVATDVVTGVSDTTGMIVVDLPTADEVPIGDAYVQAEETAPILIIQVHNAFGTPKAIKSLRVRDASRGAGTSQNRLSNIHALAVHSCSGIKTWPDPAFAKLAETHTMSSAVAMSFSQVTVNPGSYRTFVVTLEAGAQPRDGDSLDFFLLPALDIQTADGTVVAGPDTLNSLGFDVLDGMIAEQIDIVSAGTATVAPDGSVARVLSFDVPRNGYSSDVLEVIAVSNSGSADTTDIDSLFLFGDDGDELWEHDGQDPRLGVLSFTGNQWQLSGLGVALTQEEERFYLGARIARDAADGASMAFGIPLHGLEVASGNDGPIDAAVAPRETLTVARVVGISVRVLAVPARDLVPGASSGPLLCLELANSYTSSVAVDSIRFDCSAADAGGATRAELDSQIERVCLYLNRDGDHLVRGPADTLLASAAVSNGHVRFGPAGISLAQGGVATLYLEADLSLINCKNANTVGFTVASAQRIGLSKPAPVSGDFPLANPQGFTIDIFPAEAVTLHAVDDASLLSGQTNRLVFDFELPSNGYRQDYLKSLAITNTGTVDAASVLSGVRLWADAGNPGFSETDTQVGRFDRSGNTWVISNRAVLIPVDGRRFFITVDLGATYSTGGELHFEIPVGGIGYVSGAGGPDDVPIGAPQSHVVLPPSCISVLPIPMEAASIYPGSENAQVLTFALYNGYATKTPVMRGLRLTNHTGSVSTAEFADQELGQVSLFYDSNASHALEDGDQLLGSAYFTDGGLNFAGLSAALTAQSFRYFFVVANPSLDAIDGDTASIAIEASSALTFGETVKINGGFPVSSGGPILLDGSVAAQYEVTALPAGLAAPGDQSITLLAFRPAHNGDQADTLTALTIANEGDAEQADVDSLELWYDTNADSRWGSGDLSLGLLTRLGNQWSVDGIGLPVDGSPECLFVTGDVMPEASPGASFQATVPLGGCRYASSNDGPLDSPIAADKAVVISASDILIAGSGLEPSYSVGQSLRLQVDVTNAMAVGVGGITCDLSLLGDTAAVRLDSADVGPVDLAAAETTHFFAHYTAVAPGTVSWQMRALAAQPAESSAVVGVDDVRIQTAPSGVELEIISSTPASVARGQGDVFPLSVKCRHSDTSSVAAAVRLDSIRVSIDDGTGAPIPASSVFSRIVVSTGYANLAVLENVPAEPELNLIFTEPALLAPGKEQVLSLRGDIDSDAAATSFALAIDGAASIRFADCNTRDPVAIDAGAGFPLQTPTCRINSPSRSAEVSHAALLGSTINYGQQGVDALALHLHHPGGTDESQIQLTGLTFEVVDELGEVLDPALILDEIELVAKQAVVGELGAFAGGAGPVTMWLAAPPVVSPGMTDTLRLRVSLRPETQYSTFGVIIADSTCLELRDLSSGATVTVEGHGGPGDPNPVFPATSGAARLVQAASSPEFCLESRLPASVIAGSAAVALLRLNLAYSAPTGYSDVIVRDIRVAILDTLARPLDPYEVFRRTGYRRVGDLAAFSSALTLENGLTVFSLGASGMRLEPGDQVSVEILADIQTTTSYQYMVLTVPDEVGIGAVDATDPTRRPGLITADQCAAGLPFTTPVVEIVMPAGSPVLRVSARAPLLAHPGQDAVEVLEAQLAYGGNDPQGDLEMTRWGGTVLERTAAGLLPADGAVIFEAVHLVSDGVVVASDSVLSGAAISLDLESEYIIPRGTDRVLGLLCDIRPDAPLGNYVIEFEDSTFAAFVDRGLGKSILPVVAGSAYPIRTADLSITAASLAASFTNWPNPFRPYEAPTTIGYVLEEDASVDIQVFTITGDLVKTVALGVSRAAGPHSEDSWSGFNDLGLDVVPGAYLCQITARYSSGRTEQTRRKVAVIR
jgi:uncharacterized repeat protein (TIGR01451 family)